MSVLIVKRINEWNNKTRNRKQVLKNTIQT